MTDLIAVMPAAGRASRMGTLPCSKEILPIGQNAANNGDAPVRVLADLLLEHYQQAGAGETVVVTHPDKTDIEAYFGRTQRGMNLHYRYVESASTVHSIDAAFADIEGKNVVFGFPDILLPPCRVYAPLLEKLTNSTASVILGLFATEQPDAVDMVQVTPDGQVLDILIKPSTCPEAYRKTWVVAVWNANFSDYLHEHSAQVVRQVERELYVGDMVLSAMHSGLGVEALVLSEQASLDAGTPSAYWQAVTQYKQRQAN